MFEYSSKPRKLSKRQRASLKKKLMQETILKGETWYPVEEYRRLKKEREIGNPVSQKENEICPPLPTETLYKPPEPPVREELKPYKGLIHPEVFKKLNLDTKIILFRKNLCKHLNNPTICKECINNFTKNYKIPKLKRD